MWRYEGNIFNFAVCVGGWKKFELYWEHNVEALKWKLSGYGKSIFPLMLFTRGLTPGCLSFLIKKKVPYFLLMSCDSTVCNLWKISGGMKGGTLPSSDMTLRSLVIVGPASLSTGVSDGATEAAEEKTDPMTGLQDKITWAHIGQFWFVTPGADSNFTKAVSSRRALFTRGCSSCCREDIQVNGFWLARGRGRCWWHGGSPVKGFNALPYKWFSSLQALLGQLQHPLQLQRYALPLLCGQDRKWELWKE